MVYDPTNDDRDINFEHDLVHTGLEGMDSHGWRESYYYDVYDEDHNFGLWHSIGKKVAKKKAGYAMGIWGPNKNYVGAALDSFEEHNDEHDVAGLTYECLEPMGKWKITFDGYLLPADTHDLRIDPDLYTKTYEKPAAEWDERVPVSFEQIWTPPNPPHIYDKDDRWSPLFVGHVDQFGHSRVELTIGDEEYVLEGYGFKDHSWGIRDWSGPEGWNAISICTDHEYQIGSWQPYIDGEKVCDGAIYDGDELTQITELHVNEFSAPSRREKPYPIATKVQVDLETGDSIELTGRVIKIHPILFERDRDGQREISWNDRCVMQWFLPDGEVAYGQMEFSEVVIPDQQ